jgi:hypothetical protein
VTPWAPGVANLDLASLPPPLEAFRQIATQKHYPAFFCDAIRVPFGMACPDSGGRDLSSLLAHLERRGDAFSSGHLPEHGQLNCSGFGRSV